VHQEGEIRTKMTSISISLFFVLRN